MYAASPPIGGEEGAIGEAAYVPEGGDPRMIGTEAHTAAGVGGVDDGVPVQSRRRD